MARVYVTDSAFESLATEEATLNAAGHSLTLLGTKEPDEIIRLASDAEGLLVQFAPITSRVIDSMPNLRVMVRYGVGYDNFDVEAARRRGIVACNCPGYCIDEVADHTLAMILAIARRMPQVGRETNAGNWRLPNDVMPIMSLRDKVLALVGFGSIAKQVAKRALAFGMRVMASDPLLTDAVASEYGIRAATLDQLWTAADFVSLHCPLTEGTRNIVNATALSRMKRNAVIVNNGRGGLIDEDALFDALLNKHVLYAGLDVLAIEPPPTNYGLLSLPNVLVTPHVASVSETSVDRLQSMAVDEIVRVLAGRSPLNPLYK